MALVMSISSDSYIAYHDRPSQYRSRTNRYFVHINRLEKIYVPTKDTIHHHENAGTLPYIFMEFNITLADLYLRNRGDTDINSF